MKHGDFTDLAKFYNSRPGYSIPLLQCLKNHVNAMQESDEVLAADIGAGTGKLTENLEEIGLKGYAVEPNDAMRAEGIKLFQNRNTFTWTKGSAEVTNLADNCVDWVLMGSSFHWADAPTALSEFYRILKPGGFFTAIWNPRNIESSKLHMDIEEVIYKEVPGMKRVSSGGKISSEEMQETLLKEGYFKDIIFMEAPHIEVMEKERYMKVWKSVNDIQVQAGPEGFQRIQNGIERIIKDMDEIEVPYKSRAWTVRSIKQ